MIVAGHLVGYEFRNNIMRTLQVLREHSFIRYFDEPDGNVMVLLPAVHRKLMMISPSNLPGSEVNAVLLCLAQLGKVQLNLEQMHARDFQKRISTRIDSSSALLDQIIITSANTDPVFKKILISICKMLQKDLRSQYNTPLGDRFPSTSRSLTPGMSQRNP